ncbi:male sterility protein-domain-containing protein [Mycena polygramma]|nr:male sterility protein-domain-containing protein [Mycena polygramma]
MNFKDDGAQEIPQLALPSSTSFRVPEAFVAGEMTLPALWDHHRAHSSGHPLFISEDNQAPSGSTQIMWAQGLDAMHRAGQFLKPVISFLPRPDSDADGPPVVGVLCYRDAPTSWAVLTAILRHGSTAFIISPMNSPAMLASILKNASCGLLVTGSEKATATLVRTATSLMDEDHVPLIIQAPSYQELYLSEGVPIDVFPPAESIDLDAPAMIMHSSGSSNGTPTLVTSAHRALVHQAIMTYFGDKRCMRSCFRSAMLSHVPTDNTGISAYIAVSSATGHIPTIFHSLEAPKQTTAETVLRSAVACKAYYLYSLPSFIEEWSRSPEAIQSLRQFETIAFSGSPLKPSIGNYMAKQGLRLVSISESGAVSAIRFGGDPEDWEYIQATRQTTVLWEPREGSEGLFEPVVLESKYQRVPKPNTTRLGVPARQTGDLFENHPTKDGLWRVYGRADARIIHSTGEKTDPAPIEYVISKHPLVQYALVFGQGKPRAGVLIWPREPVHADDAQAFRDRIWPSVEEANAGAPTHSRIIKETIIIASAAKPFLLTAKHSLRRSTILCDYAEEISAVYSAFDAAAVSSLAVPPPASWEFHECLAFIRAIIARVQAGSESDMPKDDENLVEHGLDSLQVPLVRNAISQALTKRGIEGRPLQSNVVYSHPTIISLAQFLSDYASDPNQTLALTKESKALEMESMLKEFISPSPSYFPARVEGKRRTAEGRIILMTGSTGSLGSHILAKLIDDPRVKHVYVLNRMSMAKDFESMRARQTVAFQTQGLPQIDAESPKISYLAGDCTLPSLGLDAAVHEEICDTVTEIIHNAWAVNFLLPLSSFRPLLQSLRNILDFALSCEQTHPPKFLFMSTISVARRWTDATIVPAQVLPDPFPAIGMGYSESKWIAEQMIHFTRETSPLKPVIARLGQLCASSAEGGGRWNPNEWFPLIVRSAATTGSLPLLTGDVSWIPLNIAASAVLDLINAPPTFECANIVHPHPVAWTTILNPLAETLSVPIVPYYEWVESLRRVAETDAARETPAIALLDIFMSQRGGSVFIDGDQKFDLENTRTASPAFAKDLVPPLAAKDVSAWLQYWKTA